ncbi:hypothetical protein [Streptomyces sp. NPDC005525]|uniref:hypothetical protein n=1 Tax=Streptomyces sp. NPDC005525 TaxID=3364720 RepID=UPI0036A72E3D
MPAEPAAFYGDLHEYGPVVPVHLDGTVPAWLVIGYDVCNQVLRDGLRFSRDLGLWGVTERGELPPDWPLAPHVTRMDNMLYASGQEHVRLRGAFKAGLRKVGAHWRNTQIRIVADQLIDSFVDAGRADIVGQYAVPLPVAVLTRLFGFPLEEAEVLQRAVLTLLDGGEGALAAHEELSQTISMHVHRRRREPRTDMVTGLLEAGLTEEETIKTLWLSINAGIGATTAWTANACVLLARAEDVRIDLRGSLRDIPSVMERVLWDHTPVQQVIGRIATTDVDLHGTLVRRGDLLILSLAGANLDPRFGGADARTSNTNGNGSHLAWGNGAHECPAPDLAKAIVEIGVGRAWTRLDDIELTDPSQRIRWRDSIIVRMPEELNVSWDPARARARAKTLAPIGE